MATVGILVLAGRLRVPLRPHASRRAPPGRGAELPPRTEPGQRCRLRDEARRLAPQLDADAELKWLDQRIGALLGTHPGPLASSRARAVRTGLAWDENRLPLFDALLAALNAYVPVDRPERPADAGPPFAFFEAYFSNYIESTEFLVEEAEAIVF